LPIFFAGDISGPIMDAWILANRALEFQLRDCDLTNTIREEIQDEFMWDHHAYAYGGSKCERTAESFWIAIHTNYCQQVRDA